MIVFSLLLHLSSAFFMCLLLGNKRMAVSAFHWTRSSSTAILEMHIQGLSPYAAVESIFWVTPAVVDMLKNSKNDIYMFKSADGQWYFSLLDGRIQAVMKWDNVNQHDLIVAHT